MSTFTFQIIVIVGLLAVTNASVIGEAGLVDLELVGLDLESVEVDLELMELGLDLTVLDLE